MTSKHLQIFAAALLLLAVILGAVAWKSAHRPPAPAAAQQNENGKTLYPVVVTVKPLEAGKPITADQVAVESLPINPADAFADAGKVVGREPITPIGTGVPLIGSQLSSGLALQVAPGQRAVAITVDEVVGVGNRVMPGDYVDVFLVLRKDGQEIDDSKARLLLPHLRVLAVPVESVSQLAIAHQSGRLLLALRNPSDDAEPTVRPQDAPALAVVSRNPLDAAQAGASLVSVTGAPRRPMALSSALPAVATTHLAVRSAATATAVEIIRAGKREEQHD
ncbi:Flp pilus assembly protein CpaB (plasmid) [Ralstonia solanacearum]|nr:Flp pilus assembly protein CpaB [Ralstonia solanacearum]